MSSLAGAPRAWLGEAAWWGYKPTFGVLVPLGDGGSAYILQLSLSSVNGDSMGLSVFCKAQRVGCVGEVGRLQGRCACAWVWWHCVHLM